MQPTPLDDVALYYKGARPEVADFVPAAARRILDVGCGAGVFGGVLRDERAAEVWGIEMNPDMEPHATARLDRILIGDCRELMPTLDAGSFDVVVFADVLEHLADPAETLRETARLLAPDGCVVASLPNLRYWEALAHVVWEGDFRYREEGIFDRTHLRFFTKKSIPRLFEDAGFGVVSLEGVNANYGRKLKLLNLLTGGRFEDSKYWQFVVVARVA